MIRLKRLSRLRVSAGAVILLAICGSLTGCGTRPEHTQPPNIVFIVIDTLRADHLQSYGYAANTAPTFDGLAQGGVLFERVIAPSSWTKTSMASIMTARNPSGHGVLRYRDVLPDKLVTLAEALSAGGYETIGVNTNPWLQPQFGFGAGFRVYETLREAKESGRASEVNSRALALLKERIPGAPVFLYLHYMDVHGPYRPAPEFRGGEPVSLPGRGVIDDDSLEEEYRKQGLRGPEVQERVVELYDGGIRTLDTAVGSLLTDLRRLPDFENTLVVVTADHGESFLEHGTTEHGWNLYPEVTRVPLLFFWPDHLPAATRIGAQVRSIDVAPTLLALVDIDPPDSFQGSPLLPMVPGAIEDRIAHSEVRFRKPRPPYHRTAVISPDHLYQREILENRVEFYDLRSDPGAQHDLGAAHPAAATYAELETFTPLPTPKQKELTPETRKELEALGYLQ